MYFLLQSLLGEWSHWLTKVEEYVYPDDSVPEFSSILVPNVDNIRTNFLIETVSKQNKVSYCGLIPSEKFLSKNKTEHHDITEILYKVALSTIP